MSVNKKILEYLKAKKISQLEVAEKMGVSAPSLNKTLKNDGLRVNTLIEICKAIDISPTYFLGSEEEFSPQATKDLINDLKREVTGLQSQLEFSNKLFQNETIGRVHYDRYFCETLEFLLLNPSLINKVHRDFHKQVVRSLRENVFCRFEYGYSQEKFMKNIVYIIDQMENLPFEGNEYDAVFKTDH